MSTTTDRVPRSFRFPADDYAEIEKRAREHGLDRTRYLLDAALGRLPTTKTADERLTEIEQRINRLEQALFDG